MKNFLFSDNSIAHLSLINGSRTIDPVRVVQVGVENFGRHRRNTLRESGLFRLEAVYDWDQEACRLAGREEGCSVANSYEELLETAGVEAVVISTGALHHAAQIESAARKGLHVFVEKPVCATPEEADGLLQLEKETGVIIGVGHVAHYSSEMSLVTKRMIESGELGTIASFQKTTADHGGLTIRPGDWRGDPEKNPGGILFQCGVHGFHELMFYFGPVREVYATMRYDVHTTQTADVAICHLKFESGLVGTLSAFHVTPYKHSLQIYGTGANLYREDRFFDEGSVLQMQKARMDGGKEPVEEVSVPAGSEVSGNLVNFFRAIRESTPVYPSLRDGLSALRIVFAAEQSARTGMPVVLGDG
ncbi:Gfo/Idh/MocA family protein [Puniceicoccus vermicola]|uniref:Gfo/Idh/MocA family oxidoreductase n=1 Tax=Puniceicoccus vermicola TaxID=388746 RepID=A0A7X1E598_9BACT|nr:Gfo/Idh/MocA family oxidoreductase [Puniceicoccus vermicola]MBC2602946.1 Gfo/Idh/MocA family oxidoreductase [Puniceicoccus vermicola]